MSNLDTENINFLYNHLSMLVQKRSVTLDNIVDIALSLIKVAEKIVGLKGVERKEYVLYVLRMFIEDTIPSELPERRILISFIDFTLPRLIDVMISLDKGEIQIALKKVCGWCC